MIPFKAKLALWGACLFWAASFIATKTALNTIPPLTVVMLRLVVSSLCFVPWMLVKREKSEKLPGSVWGYLFLLSLFGTGLHYSIQTIGIRYTTASNASLYAATGPISITIIAAVFLSERITWKKAVGIGIAVIGVLLVNGIDALRDFRFEGHLVGDVLVFLSIFMWGVFTVMGKRMIHRVSAVRLTAIVTFMGTLYMIPIGVMESAGRSFSFSTIPVQAWGAVAFLGITCSFLATLLYVYALQQTETQKAGVYLYTIPPMTYIIAALVLNEAITVSLITGSLVVIAGVFLTERG